MLELATVSLLNGVVYGLLLFMLSQRPDADLQHDGRAQFRARERVHARRVFLATSSARWIGFWPALVIAPAAVRPGRRGASSATACATCTQAGMSPRFCSRSASPI